MIRLVYSNRTEELARTLARDLEAARKAPGASVFDPLTLVVPNKNVEIFVKLALARAHGIAANLDVHLLRRFLGTAAARGTRGARLVEPDTVTGLLLDRLIDSASLARPELDAVRHYLTSAGDAPDAVDLRRIGLATHVARLFEEYGYSRPDMLGAWEAGPVLENSAFASAETWQRRLWLDLFEPTSGLVTQRAAAVGERWLSLADLFAEVSPAALHVPPRVHLFGISYVSRAFHTLFARLAEACELHIYTLNPCMEFWEDVGDAMPRRDAARFPKRERRGDAPTATGSSLYGDDDPFHLDSPQDPPALRLWGRPGRENVRLLNELASCDFEAAFVDPLGSEVGETTLLRALQHDILVRDEEALPTASADASLRVLACPSIRREAEVVASAIWSLVRENANEPAQATGRSRLRFNEIAVIVPNGEYDAYHTHIGAAFAEAYTIPHHVLDVPLARTSRVAEALDLLLSLPFGTFTRKEVMRIVVHPAVMARFPGIARDDWALLPARLGVVHGKDHADHEGTYIDRDILNWDQGVRRLALGAFMTGETRGDARPYVRGDGDNAQAYLPEEAQGASREAVAAFGALVSSLLADARYAKSAELTMADWSVFLRAIASSYVAPSNDAEERALFECLDALGSLTDFDLGDRKVSYRIASELARARLTGLTSARDGYLAGGVAVASFLPMRAIPFKAIFVMGLGEGKFPQGDPRDPLDLRLESRRPGDVRPREQDKYMFLETVLCARDRLYLSYVDRDALTGEALSPSSVVSDVLGMLEGHLGKEATASLATRLPLRRYGELDFPSIYDASSAQADRFGAPLAARREAQAAALRRDLEAHLGAAAPDLATLRRGLKLEIRRTLDARLGLQEIPDAADAALHEQASATTVSLSISALRKFLECPLQGYARYRLGLDEDDDTDPLDAEDELLETPALARTMFLRQVFLEAHERSAPLGATYDEKRTRLELAGGAPVGLFAEAEREAQLAVLDGWARLVEENGGSTADGQRSLTPARFGRAEEHVEATALYDAVVLDVTLANEGGRAVRVEIHGATQPLTRDPSTSWMFVARAAPSGGSLTGKVKKRAIAAFLDHVLLAATADASASAAVDRGHTANLCFASVEGSRCIPVVFPALSRDDARAYLAAVASDLLSGHHAYLLPCEAVIAYLDDASPSGDFPIGENVEALVDAYESDPDRNRFSSVDGPLAHAERYAPPDEATAGAIIERRFGLFAKGRVAAMTSKEPA